ncbi:MAG TPA: aspartate/glutamate racemase family protein [Anaerolineaceae bacterium]|nr:aspartate/glutamate racemase family protein [Anaerolineaceae bacterium]
MKTIGLIGGMSWESTITYYEILNSLAREKFGGFHSAKVILFSVDFAEIEGFQRSNQWFEAGQLLAAAAKGLEAAGADCLVLCTNTLHKISDQIVAATNLPFIHIADALLEEIHQKGYKKVGLLGTKYTMGESFYSNRLLEAGIDVLVPNQVDQDTVNSVIFNELCLGNIEKKSQESYVEIIRGLVAEGAQAVILGCTEIGLLLNQADLPEIPLLDTTEIHARKAFECASN